MAQGFFLLPKAGPGDVPIMLALRLQIDNGGRSLKLLIRDIPNPEGAVAEPTNLGRPVQTPTLGLLINPRPKGFGRLNHLPIAG